MNNLHNDPQVPSFFECPISLEIMKDPVTLSTGITYDRDSIEKWLFSQKNAVCPVTKQMLDNVELTPNLTLRRLIQSWCTVNTSYGVEMLPKPRLLVTKPEIIQLLQDLTTPHLRMKSLKRLKTLVFDNETNQRLLESVGAADHLVFIIMAASSSPAGEVIRADEALTILCHLKLSPTGVRSLLRKMGDFVEALTHLMQRASFESRANAVMLLKSIFEVTDPMHMHMHMHVTSLNPKFFTELIRILIDQISPKATKATLDLLINVCPSRRNAIKAAEAGAVAVLINTLLNHPEKRVSEMIIMVLDQLCRCAEGRAELLQHRGGLAVLSKKIFRVSSVVSESAVRILYSVAKFSGERGVVEEMMEVGVVGKLCLVMEVDCGKKMKEKAKEMLKMNARVWKGSSCIPYNLVSSYPS